MIIFILNGIEHIYEQRSSSSDNRAQSRGAMCSLGLLLLAFVSAVSVDGNVYDIVKPTKWWQTTTVYQIWPRSFKDSDGDGIGDLNGITSKLDHFVDMGIETIWLSPFYTSPLVDSGYDISDFLDVNPVYGTLDDFDNLVVVAKSLGLKVVLDFVPNHVSDEHVWYEYAKAGIEPYVDYFIWNEGKLDANGTRQPPNNWLSVFSGSAWEWCEERQAYYFHQFSTSQIDFDLRNPLVIDETKDVMTFWLDRGIDGFRLDAAPFLVESTSLADEPEWGLGDYAPTNYFYRHHIYTKDQPENLDLVQIWKDHLDNYTHTKDDGVVRTFFTEAYANVSEIMKYYDSGSDVPFNFFLIRDETATQRMSLATAEEVVGIINKWMDQMPENGTANWEVGNHDNSRIATKLGEDRVDAINFLLFLLPGVATIYNGDEIGMTDTYLTWEETEDPQACNTDEASYEASNRDPERTPYQWDNTTSAGFSTNSTTELKVNPNYLTVNLATEKEAGVSHYKNVQAAIKLRKTTVVQEGSLDVQVIDDQVLAFARELENELPIVVVLNWSNTTGITTSLEVFQNIPDTLEVLIADINSGIAVGDIFDKTSVELPVNAAVVLRGIDV